MNSLNYDNQEYSNETIESNNHSTASFRNEILEKIKTEESLLMPTPPILLENVFQHFSTEPSALGQEIYKENDFTDVTLVTNDGREIKCHRCFLSHSSTVFKNIFEKKRTIAKIDIEFGEAATIKAVQFCYGFDQSYTEFDEQLFEFAKTYDMRELRVSIFFAVL